MSGWIVQSNKKTALSWNVAKNYYLYFGNLPVTSQQYKSGLFVGLAFNVSNDREIFHNAYDPLPLEDDCVMGIQSEDVFEHLEYDKVSQVFDEVYRVLKPGVLFRLSLPDYNCFLLKQRSVYDSEGNWFCDLACGGSVSAMFNERVKVVFTEDGNSHLWAPTFDTVTHLVDNSNLKNCKSVVFQHCWAENGPICKTFDQCLMPVRRSPPVDMRANGGPVSLVVDFIK